MPPVKDEYKELFKGRLNVSEMTEDAPIVLLARVIFQQLIGWVSLTTH